MFLAQGRKTSDQPLQVFHREILGQTINIFLARVHPKGVFASLQRLHPDPKEVSSYLNTREFLSAGVLELVDALHQGFGSRPFLGSGFRVPRSASENFFGSFKWSNAILLGVDILILDVQPSFAPPLDGVGEFDVEIINVGSNADANAAHIVDDVAGVVAPEVENALPQAPMRMGAEEALAQSDKNRNVEDGVRGQLV